MRSALTMWWCKGLLIAAVFLSGPLLLGKTARAQAFSRLGPGQQTVTLETGLEAGVTTSLGYAAGLRVDAIDRTVIPFIRGGMVVAKPDVHDYAGRAGAQVSLLERGWIDVSTQLAFGVEGTSNSIHRATTLKGELVLLVGHYAPGWFVAGEAGYDHAWLTHIENTAWYRSNFYPDAKDGWYGNTAGTLRSGLRGGIRLGRVELVLRGGLNWTERLQALDVPFYATLGANCRF